MTKFQGIVKKHMGRGNRLGFPTANLGITADIAEGVYAAFVILGEKKLPALVFSGKAVTFGDNKKLFEVYILDFNQDLYGQEIEVQLLKHMRGVEKFDTAAELILQMQKDEELARKYFKQYNLEN